MTASRRTPLPRRWKHDGYPFRRNRHQVINRTSRHHAQALAVPQSTAPVPNGAWRGGRPGSGRRPGACRGCGRRGFARFSGRLPGSGRSAGCSHPRPAGRVPRVPARSGRLAGMGSPGRTAARASGPGAGVATPAPTDARRLLAAPVHVELLYGPGEPFKCPGFSGTMATTRPLHRRSDVRRRPAAGLSVCSRG